MIPTLATLAGVVVLALYIVAGLPETIRAYFSRETP